MEYTTIDSVIARVLSGEASSDDIFCLSDWLNQDKRNKEEFQTLKGYWDAEVSFASSVAPGLVLEKLRRKIEESNKRKRSHRSWMIFTPLAASMAALIIISMLYFFEKQEKQKEYYSYVTGNNKSEFLLTDGTHVILNKYSKLTYSNVFGEGSRQVSLEGEAYFEVTKDSSRIFEVSMDKAAIKVFGTKFNVKANPSDNNIEATLVEGSIRFESETQKIFLTPGQQLVFNKETSKIDVTNTDPEVVSAWKDDLNKYKSISLKSLTEDLEKKCHVKIVISNTRLNNVIVSGSFSTEQTIEETLDVISRSIPMTWSKRDSIYYIK